MFIFDLDVYMATGQSYKSESTIVWNNNMIEFCISYGSIQLHLLKVHG